MSNDDPMAADGVKYYASRAELPKLVNNPLDNVSMIREDTVMSSSPKRPISVTSSSQNFGPPSY